MPSHIKLLDPLDPDEERSAFIKLNPPGFFIRHPPKPHLLHSFLTPDESLFQTIHMGGAVIDLPKWRLKICGLVHKPFTLDLSNLKSLPSQTITSFHECFGSPLKPPTDALWRIGNVQWTGVKLKDIMKLAEPMYDRAKFVWSEGLDRGSFGGIEADRYQKDLPIEKAMRDEVMLVYAINGEPLSRERGGPVRLVVPGWFGTNSTKWLSKLEVAERRAGGPFVTKFYNVPDPTAESGTRPVWRVEINSIVTRPEPGESFQDGEEVLVEGWAWDEDGVEEVGISVDGGANWVPAEVDKRVEFSWQRFRVRLRLEKGNFILMSRAVALNGSLQPLTGHRNHCHSVEFHIGGH